MGEGESGRIRDHPLAPSPPLPLSRLRGKKKVKARPSLEAPLLFCHFTAIALALVPPLFFGFAVAPAAFRILPTRDMAASLTSPILTKACWLAEGGRSLPVLPPHQVGEVVPPGIAAPEGTTPIGDVDSVDEAPRS